MVARAMPPDLDSDRHAFALTECERLFGHCRTTHEALLIPSLAIWSALSGGEVQCGEDLPRFGRVSFLLDHWLVLKFGRRWRKQDNALIEAGFGVTRLDMSDPSELHRELHCAFGYLRASGAATRH